MKMTYKQAVDYINDTPRFTKKNTLENTREILRRLGNPEDSMKIIHVAGTNGKGSVCAFLSSILTKAGCRTGLFTSPHLVDMNERFQINQEDVSDEQFLHAFTLVMDQVKEIEKDGFCHPTFFEILFLMGMVLFKEAGVEYLVLETGLGGRLDATNAIAHPIATVITSISLDHTEYLGETLAAIAGEKAGIMKSGAPVIYDATRPEVEAVILKRAGELQVPAFGIRRDMYKISETSDTHIAFSVNSPYDGAMELSISSVAEYQVMNALEAVTAIAAIDREKVFTREIIQAGIAGMKWQGRMETVLPGVILDGAHNEDGVEEFVRTVERLQKGTEITLLFSAVKEKNFEQMIQTICERVHFQKAIITEIDDARAVPVQELAALFRKYSKSPVQAEASIEKAFAAALEEKKDGILFCVGSLYLVGSIKGIIRRQKA